MILASSGRNRQVEPKLLLQARFRDGWQPLPVLLADPEKPNVTESDVDFFTRDLAPKLREHRQRYRQVYTAYRDTFPDKEAIARDTAIALSLLDDGLNPDRVALTLNESDTFCQLSPGEAIDYRQTILKNALELREEREEARRETEIDR